MDADTGEKKILNDIRHLIGQKKALDHKFRLLEQVLVKNNIYIIIFDKDLHIVYHNIPSKFSAYDLFDFQYLIGEGILKEIAQYAQPGPGQNHSKDNGSERQFQAQDFRFSLSSNQELFFLQLVGAEQKTTLPDSETVEILDQASSRLDEVSELIKALENIRRINRQIPQKNISKEIIQVHLPALTALKRQIKDPVLKISLDIIETNLREIVTPDSNINKSIYNLLTPSEIQIAEFIRMGKSTKDIADALDIATKTVENHRNNLRHKLGLSNKGVNLRSYLMQLGDRTDAFLHLQ